MTLKVGIVSAAWGGMAHLPAWRAVPGVEVTAICTSREETARAAVEQFKVERPFWDALEMCADPDIDIVDLGTRPNWRLPWVLAALEHGKHVYNSSPHAPDWEGAGAIDAAWKAAGTVGVVDAFVEWVPAIRQQIALIEDGYLGTPFSGTCHFNISLFNQPMPGFPYNWFADGEAGVSGMRNNGSHALYPLLKAFGPVEELVADDRQLLGEWRFPDGSVTKPDPTDFGSAMLRFASGFVLQLQASWAMTLHDGWLLDVFGEKGRLVTTAPTFPTARDCVLRGAQLTGDPRQAHMPTVLPELDIPDEFRTPAGLGMDWQVPMQPSFPMAVSMERMVAAIQGKGDAEPTFARALEVERIQRAITVSQDVRRWVKLAEIG